MNDLEIVLNYAMNQKIVIFFAYNDEVNAYFMPKGPYEGPSIFVSRLKEEPLQLNANLVVTLLHEMGHAQSNAEGHWSKRLELANDEVRKPSSSNLSTENAFLVYKEESRAWDNAHYLMSKLNLSHLNTLLTRRRLECLNLYSEKMIKNLSYKWRNIGLGYW